MTEINKFQKSYSDIQISKGADYEIYKDRLVIFNVPLTGEIVQEYDDGFAFKPAEEILKIDVQNIPVTFLHPDDHLEQMDTKQVAEKSLGFLRKPSLDRKETYSKKKLYADMVIFRNERTEILEEKLSNDEGIDVSIGFTANYDITPGTALGKDYDFVQRNIALDHLAILMDEEGFIYEGRASYKAGYGIGADQANIKRKVDEKIIEKTLSDNKKMASDISNLTRERNEAVDKSKNLSDELKKSQDSVKTISDENKTLKDSLKVFEDAETALIDNKRKTLSEKYPNMDSVFKTADSKSINTAFDKMEEESKKNPKKDMSSQGGEGNSEGENSEAKKEQDAFDLQFKVKKENK